MARWASNNNQKLNSRAMNENVTWMGNLLSQKSGNETIQNCDLPPPLKVYFGSGEEDKNYVDLNEKLEVFKALRLSQTRAREAEKKAANLVEENERVCDAFLKESMELFAYRQWVRLLEVQVSKLQSEIKKQEHKLRLSYSERRDCEDRDDGFCWFAALAFCLGFAFGFRYLF